MDNAQFSNLVSSQVSASDGFTRESASRSFTRKRGRMDDSDEDDERLSRRRRQRLNEKQEQKEPQDSTKYRDRAKERREGTKSDDESGAMANLQNMMASDATFEHAVTEFEEQPQSKSAPEGVNEHETNSFSNRGCFDTADQAIQWANGKMPELPWPRSDVANGIVALLRNTTAQSTPQHLSLHRSNYTFGTQWNPWWERPLINTFYNSKHEKQPWSSFPEDAADMIKQACKRISDRKEQEELQRDAALKQHDAPGDTAVEESDEDDIFAGAGDYDASVAIKEEEVATETRPALKGPLFGSAVAKDANDLAQATNNNDTEQSSPPTRPLKGFSETMEASGVDMDFEVHEQDRKKKKKKRRKKGDDDSDE